MSIRDRILKAAKSNLNQLLEKAADATDPRRRLADVSDHELEAELERRRAERADRNRVDDAKARVEGVVADRATRDRAHSERAARVSAEQAASRPAPEPSPRRRPSEPPPPRSSAGSARAHQAKSSGRTGFGRRPDKKLEKYYQILELSHGATFQEVKSAYRRLMRKYHPDFHRSSPEKHRAAVEVSQALTDAYNHLERELTGK